MVNIAVTDWSSFDQVLATAAKYQVGLEVQEFVNPQNLENPEAIVAAINEKAKKLPLLNMHGPFAELVPASWDPLVRQVARTRLQQGYELAQRIGADNLILHSGFFPKTYKRETWIQNSYDFWVDFLADKPKPNLIHVENVYEDDCTSLGELVDRVNQFFKDDRLTVCLDIGHVNANSSRTFEEWISGLGDRIRYVHLHNNDGILDDHWGLGRGKINVAQVLELLKRYSPNAIWTVETFVVDIEPSLIWLRERGYL